MRGGTFWRRTSRRDEYQEEDKEECVRVTAFSHTMMILNEDDDAKKCTVEVCIKSMIESKKFIKN
jgi:hypothetical protein